MERTVLKRGDEGPAVVELQAALGMPNEAINATYDEITQGEVFKFQIEHGLKADGIAGEKTLAVLFKT